MKIKAATHMVAGLSLIAAAIVHWNRVYRSAVEDVNKLVAGEMGFPVTFPRELGGEKGAVAVGSQSRTAALRSAIVDCGVRPRNTVSFASSALRSMMLGVPLSISFSI